MIRGITMTEGEFSDQLIKIDKEAATKKQEAAKSRANLLIKEYGLKRGQIIKWRNNFIFIERLSYGFRRLEVIIHVRGEKLKANKKPRKVPVKQCAYILNNLDFEIVGK